MYERSDKRRIYQLIDMYLSGYTSEAAFSEEFYYSYDLGVDHRTLAEEEHKAFLELSEIAGRFSEFEEDIKQYPGVYYNKKELRQKVIDTKEKLKDFFEAFDKLENKNISE